jgi:hypothetical protein
MRLVQRGQVLRVLPPHCADAIGSALMRWCPWRGYRNLANSKAYRVPLLPSVPLNSKAYFPRCPTDFSGLRRSWESNHGRGRESNHGHRRWLVATPRHSKHETQLAGTRADGFVLTLEEAAGKCAAATYSLVRT